MNSKMDLPRLEFDKLPLEFTFPGLEHIRVRAELYSEKHWPMLHHHVQESTETGSGFPEETLLSILKERHESGTAGAKLVFLNASNGEFIAAVVVKPSNLCRSERPVYSMGFVLVNKVHRGQQIAFYIMKMYNVFSKHFGYRGTLGKIAMFARSLIPSMKARSHFLGTIPWSSYLKGKGWSHDVIVHGKYDQHYDITDNSLRIPALGDRKVVEASYPVSKRPSPTHHLPNIHHKEFGNLKISPADKDERWKIQHILRECALEGDGVGIDEFTNNGVFNEKLLRDCCHWVVKRESDDQILAIVLSGQAGHRRSGHELMANGLIVVLKSFRRQGLASQLLKFGEVHCQKLGFKHILTDVVACNLAGLALLEKHGFIVTATVPNSCAMSRHGQGVYVNSTLHWKPFIVVPSASL